MNLATCLLTLRLDTAENSLDDILIVPPLPLGCLLFAYVSVPPFIAHPAAFFVL